MRAGAGATAEAKKGTEPAADEGKKTDADTGSTVEAPVATGVERVRPSRPANRGDKMGATLAASVSRAAAATKAVGSTVATSAVLVQLRFWSRTSSCAASHGTLTQPSRLFHPVLPLFSCHLSLLFLGKCFSRRCFSWPVIACPWWPPSCCRSCRCVRRCSRSILRRSARRRRFRLRTRVAYLPVFHAFLHHLFYCSS